MESNELLTAELDSLKAKADRLGVKYRDNISYERLAERVAEAEAALEEAKPEVSGDEVSKYADSEVEGEETPEQRRLRKRREAEELLRIRVTPMDRVKAQLDGEIFTAGNRNGTVRKYVPFDTEWHVPRIIYNVIKGKKTQIFVDKRNEVTGEVFKTAKMINAYAVEILPPLSEEELKDLAQRQAMAGGTSKE